MKTLQTLPRLRSLLLATVLSACSIVAPSGSGDAVSITSDKAGFDRVMIGDAFRVSIRQGEDFSVVLRVDQGLEDEIQVSQIGQTLTIGLRPDPTRGRNRVTLEADITMPVLTALEASGASRVGLSGFESQNDLELVASGGSVITGDIQAGGTTVTASGASDISLVGGGEDLVLTATGASSVDLDEFPVVDVRAVLDGASTAVVNASGTLEVEASGGSHLAYVGNPALGNVQTSVDSSVGKE